MEFPREVRWLSVLIALSCSITLLVCTPLWPGSISPDKTSTKTIVTPPNYFSVDPDSNEIYIQYDYDQPPTIQDSWANRMKYSEDNHAPTPDNVKSTNQFSSGTAFVDYYLAPMGQTYRFLDKNRLPQWGKLTLKYTLIDLDSSLSYKSKMMGWDFKAKVRMEVLDESSLFLNWSRDF